MYRLIGLIVVCCLFNAMPAQANSAYSLGFKRTDITAEQTQETFPVAIIYPSHIEAKPVRFGPFHMELAIGAAIAEGHFPLVIISHGSGGSNLGYRSIAFELVKRGFVVAIPLHPKNNFKDNSAEGTLENWQNRPQHIKATIDAVLTNKSLSASIDSSKVAVIGHSAGAYTALAVAGGDADTAHILELCNNKPQLNKPFCGLIKDQKAIAMIKPAKIDNVADNRVKAIVLMAPVGILFKSDNALSEVDIPTLLINAEKDEQLIEPYHSELIANNFQDSSLVTFRTIENAGHYSFITPFPESIKNQVGPAGQDPDGFDREAFHQIFSVEIADYLTAIFE